jgi:3-hydroxyacyl-CoA dehydrogenase
VSHVSIIGAGNMGQAIATIVTKGGNTVEVFNNNDADKPVTGDVSSLLCPTPRSPTCLHSAVTSSPARSSSASRKTR